MKLPFIKAYTDRHGRPRYYFRRKGYQTIALPSPQSPGFMTAYEAANKPQGHRIDASKIVFLSGTLGWLIDQFVSTFATLFSRLDTMTKPTPAQIEADAVLEGLKSDREAYAQMADAFAAALKAAVAAEREACAQVADAIEQNKYGEGIIAAAIRARKP